MIRFVVLWVLTVIFSAAGAQTAAPDINFVSYQRSFPVFNEALKHKEDTLMKQFAQIPVHPIF